MNAKQLNTAITILIKLHEEKRISKMDYWNLEGAFIDIYNGEVKSGRKYIQSMETLPREKGFDILKTIGYDFPQEKPEWTCIVSKRTTGIPWIWRGQEAKILDCEEINEEAEMYTYHLEMEYNGRIYQTWINSEDVEI
jgi:hypothetical protein